MRGNETNEQWQTPMLPHLLCGILCKGTRTQTCHKSHLCGQVHKKCRTLITGPAFWKTLRLWPAPWHFTRAIFFVRSYKESAERRWYYHEWTTELTVTVRHPSVSPRSFMKNRSSSAPEHISGSTYQNQKLDQPSTDWASRLPEEGRQCGMLLRARNGTRERRLDPRAHNGPRTAGWIRDRRMDPRAEDGPESAGWARERRMDPRAEDEPESV